VGFPQRKAIASVKASGDIVSIERAAPALPSARSNQQMARRRYQSPTPKVENDWWCIRYRIDEFDTEGKLNRPLRYARLAPAGTPLREVLKLRDEFLAPFNTGAVNAGGAVVFSNYVKHVYRTTDLPLLEPASQDCYNVMIDTHLLPAFGKMMLRDINKQTVQMFSTKLSVTPRKIRRGKKSFRTAILCLETRTKIWTVLSAIFTSAIGYKHVTENPAREIELGSDPRASQPKRVITREQFQALLKLIAEPYASFLFVDVMGAFRPSETAGLKVKNIHKNTITVEAKFSRGRWGRTKTEKSAATISVAASVIERIRALKNMKVKVKAGNAVREVSIVKSWEAEDLVFQSVYGGGPINADNILRRHVKPAAAILGIPWVNWQVMRRSAATWHKKAGNHPKDAQHLLRHAKSKTTLDIYTQTDDDAQREAVDRMEQYAGFARPTNVSPDQRSLWEQEPAAWIN
jgi:integrase